MQVILLPSQQNPLDSVGFFAFNEFCVSYFPTFTTTKTQHFTTKTQMTLG